MHKLRTAAAIVPVFAGREARLEVDGDIVPQGEAPALAGLSLVVDGMVVGGATSCSG